ncbi:MAG: hypothetical protein PHO93_02825 [Candidatus Saccharimonadaceae bacterium]|nr:hypothetical protein [Candidatus Saccharimonadaceae bacterium]
MNKEELLSLREKILQDVMPLVIDNEQNGVDRFDLLIRLIHAGNASSEIYRRAYDSAKAIEDNGERLDALMSLLDEIEFDVNQPDEKVSQPEPEPENIPAEHPVEYPVEVNNG